MLVNGFIRERALRGAGYCNRNTGLDLRVFEDAITFKIALMVVKYMKYMETLDY